MESLARIAAPVLADTGAAVLITVVVLVALVVAIYVGRSYAKRKGWID